MGMFPIQENMVSSAHAREIQNMLKAEGNETVIDKFEGHLNRGFDVWYPHIKSFLKVFRLSIMGDFDMFDLEGIDPVMIPKKPWPNSSTISSSTEDDIVVAEIDDGETEHFHFAVCVFFMM